MKTLIGLVADASDRILRLALIVLMTVLVLTITWQVASRYFLGDPSSWTEELARFTLIWAGLLGAAYAYRTNAHVGIDILAGKLSNRGRRVLEVITAVCVIVFSLAVIVGGGSSLVMLTAELEQTSASLGVQMSSVYAVIPLSGVLLTFYALVNIVEPVDHSPAHQEAGE
jgi:TRAP-type C4-dicarboxylate transport system permease small subunit